MAVGLALSALAAHCSTDDAGGGTDGSGGTASNTGGISATTGGTLATGGVLATGGTPSIGGVSNTGGTAVTGGVGGTAQTGQSGNANGGTSGGGAASGGASGGAVGDGGKASGGSSTGGSAGNGNAGKGGSSTGGVSSGGSGGASTGGASNTGGASSGGAGGKSGTLRIMPLGDSTTGSVCWRANLWTLLNQAGHTGKFDFVGTRKNDSGCGVSGYDQDNEGHPSVLVTNFVNDADDLVTGVQTVQQLLGRNPADVVLFHFATNDVWNGISNTNILTAYSTVLAALRQANPKVVVLVATLIPMAVTASTCSGCSCANCPTQISSLNSMLAGWASSNGTSASPIVVVDQNTGLNAAAGSDTSDGVHPNASGSSKIANKWAQALASYF